MHALNCSDMQAMEAIEKRLLVPEIKYFRQLASKYVARSKSRSRPRMAFKPRSQSLANKKKTPPPPKKRTPESSQHPLAAIHTWGKQLSRRTQRQSPAAPDLHEQWHCSRAFVQLKAAVAVTLVLQETFGVELMRVMVSGCRLDYKYDSKYVCVYVMYVMCTRVMER